VLVGGIPTPLKKYESIGMIIPNIWKKNVPNHLPDVENQWFLGK